MKIEKANPLFSDVKHLIDEARKAVATTVNAATTMLYWNIGKRIHEDILDKKRAEYGKQIILTLSRQLTEEYGKGWSEKQLRHCLYIVETFPDFAILSTLCRELSWSHLKVLMYLKDDIKREFYTEMSRIENWNVRVLNKKIDSMLFERTAISKKPDELIREELKELQNTGKTSPDLVFRDPYFLNFLGLEDRFSEKNLEDAILREIEKFILELGHGFSFVERQKQMLIDGNHYKVDLLFYHRRLRRLVAIDLKLGSFKAEYKGKMELYLRYLEKHEVLQGEESPIGLILCSEGSSEQIELMQLHTSDVKVAEYLTELPPKELLKEKLHKVIKREKERLIMKKLEQNQ